uniref:tetratricopeptide repeat protein n=1 Tax=Pontiella sp. TaxID=2837462 RepID=UPI00356A9AF1
NMGITMFHAGRLDEAEVALNTVLGEDPDNDTARAMLGMIELQKRDWGGATTELTKSATVNPADPAAQNALALAQLQQTKNVNAAINRLKGVVNAYPDYAPALFNLGAVYEFYVKNSAQAMSWYNQYLAKAGADGSHVQAANAALARLGGRPATTQDDRNLPRANPAEALRYMNEGLKLYGAQKYDDAVAAFKKALMADPKQKNAYYNLGLTFYAQGNFSDAATACNNAVNLDPNFSDAQYMLSLAYAKQKKWSDAERAARELLKTDKAKGEQMLKYIGDIKKR